MTEGKVWRLVVQGEPIPKGSMKCIGQRGQVKHALVPDDSSGKGKVWREHLTSAAEVLAGRMGGPLDEHVVVGVLIVVPRPASARKRLLPNRRSSGDWDKHLRMLLDALTDGGVMTDDSRVVLSLGGKVHQAQGRPSGAVVYVSGSVTTAPRILNALLQVAPELTQKGF